MKKDGPKKLICSPGILQLFYAPLQKSGKKVANHWKTQCGHLNLKKGTIHIEAKWRIAFWNNNVLGSIMVRHYMSQTQKHCLKFAYHRNHNKIHHVVWNSCTQFKISDIYAPRCLVSWGLAAPLTIFKMFGRAPSHCWRCLFFFLFFTISISKSYLPSIFGKSLFSKYLAVPFLRPWGQKTFK